MPFKDPEKQRDARRRSDAKRRATVAAAKAAALGDLDAAPEPPSREDVLKVLGVKAREGNVAACKALLEEYRRDIDRNESEKPTRSAIDELARRRASRAS